MSLDIDVEISLFGVCLMDNKIKYSIIVPVYNAELWIRRCIESIITQSVSDFELLLIDDGSTDNSGVICDEYALTDNRIRVFHKSNGGVSSARNVGINYCNGEYIIFIDSDDWIHPEYISELSTGINTDLTICTYKLENASDIEHPNVKDGLHNAKDIKNLLESGLIMEAQFSAPWCKLYKHSIIKAHDIRFHENITIGEDTLFVLQYLCYAQSFIYINKKLYHCWHSDSSLSSYGNSSENFFNFEQKLSEITAILSRTFDIEKISFKAHILINILGNYINQFRTMPDRKERIVMIKNLRAVNDIDGIYKLLYGRGVKNIICAWLFKYRLYNLYDWLQSRKIRSYFRAY